MRFKFRRYYIAKEHVRTINHSDLISSNAANLEIANLCLPIEDSNAHFDPSCDDSESFTSNTTTNSIRLFEDSFNAINLDDYNETMQRYIAYESQNKHTGVKRIVACAFAMNIYNDNSSVSIEEVLYHLKATLFCYQLTSSQKAQFSSVCNMMASTFYSSFSSNSNLIQTTPLLSAKDIDRYYLNISTSIANNVPIPIVEEIDNHAYISIKQSIQHFLAFTSNIDGILTDEISENYHSIVSASSAISKTNKMREIRSKVKSNISLLNVSPIIIYVILWSDDFEPNNVKQHKKSTWIKTLTISPPFDCQTSTRHTYVIALGSKSLNHELVNHYFIQELKSLQTPTYMYCKVTNCNIPVVVETLAVSADRPERSALNGLLGHNGLCSRRWRYSAFINPN